MKLKSLTGFILLGFIVVSQGQAMSVDQAYRSIPHRQTTFDKITSRVSGQNKMFLKKMFMITDDAMVARLEHLSQLYYFKGKGDAGKSAYNRKINPLLRKLKTLPTPTSLKNVHRLVLEAIEEQKQLLNQWAIAPMSKKQEFKKMYTRHPLVLSSHNKLIKAYETLMGQFPKESAMNKRAFFDHLCALDFL